jgi:hypothetical protein
MVQIKYVFPNLQNGRNRQGLSEKWRLAKLFNCSYVEVPAIFVHNPFEAKITGKEFGDFFNELDIIRLYEKEGSLPDDFSYFFHTDPGFSPDNGYQPEYIRWFDPTWVSNYTKMLVTIAGVLGKHPEVIEIHPGSPKNTAENLVDAQYLLQSGYEEQTGYIPRIVLENLSASHVKSGAQLSKISRLIEDKYPGITNSCGLVIDMSGIRSAWNRDRIDYRESLAAIPKKAVMGIHFHCNHGRDPVDMNTEFWKYVTNWIHSIPSCIFLNPEVHRKDQFEPLFEICQREFSRKRQNSPK